MLFGIKRALVTLSALCAAAATTALFTGCEQCMADCSSTITFSGDLDLVASEKVPFQIFATYENRSVNDVYLYDKNGDGYCAELFSCELTENADGTVHLRFALDLYHDKIEEGGVAYVRFNRVDDHSEIFGDQIKVPAGAPSAICGLTCYGSSVTW